MATLLRNVVQSWTTVPKPRFVGGNQVELLPGGDSLFPHMCRSIEQARTEVWLATYIFHDDPAATAVADALKAAAARGVQVRVVVDGFGSIATMAGVRAMFANTAVQLEVFRPLDRWYSWLQPGQLRRLHAKLCVCDAETAYVGGINLIDDRHDINHGWCDAPRLDFAVVLRGPLAQSVHDTARALWARAHLRRDWREEARSVVRSGQPMQEALNLLGQLRGGQKAVEEGHESPIRAAFLVRDNLRQRRAIERSYVEAIRGARRRVDIAVPYFYPGTVSAARCSRRRAVACACACCCKARSTTASRRWPRGCCTQRCATPASGSTSTRRPSCTPRWLSWTMTGPPWAAATSTP